MVHKFLLVLQAIKFPYATAAVDKERQMFEKLRAWQLTNVKSNEMVIKKAQKEEITVHFATLMDICQNQEFGVGTPNSERRWPGRAPR